MPRAKTHRGVRLTKPPQLSFLSRQRENGRPRGTVKKFRFEETRLGFMLKYETPTVYALIMKMSPKGKYSEPKVLVIESVCGASDDVSFRKPKFFRYLEEYRESGIYCGRAQVMTPRRVKYYELIRGRKYDKFIKDNYDQIEQELKRMRAIQEFL